MPLVPSLSRRSFSAPCSFSGCATTSAASAEPIVAPVGRKPLYPAVYRAVQAVAPGASFSSVDLAKERFPRAAPHLEFSDGLAKRRLDVEITTDNGLVVCWANHEEEYDTAKSLWISSEPLCLQVGAPGRFESALCRGGAGRARRRGSTRSGRQAALSDLAHSSIALSAGRSMARRSRTSSPSRWRRLPHPARGERAGVTPVEQQVGRSNYHFQVECLPGSRGRLGGPPRPRRAALLLERSRRDSEQGGNGHQPAGEKVVRDHARRA